MMDNSSRCQISENSIEHTISYDRKNGVHIDLMHVKAKGTQKEHISFIEWTAEALASGEPDREITFSMEELPLLKQFINIFP